MAWQMNSDRPIYTQLYDKILIRIVCGIYKAGNRLPSVRELAAEANVNPNTMQRAFTELEHSGLIVTQRNSGRSEFICHAITSLLFVFLKPLMHKTMQTK